MKLSDVTLSYDTTDILRNVTIDIPPGRRLALIGASGAGKSTVVSLLRRDLDPTRGQILLDDIDLRKFSLTSVLRHVGVIPQKPEVLTGTVRENITHGLHDPEAVSDDRIWQTLDDISTEFRSRLKGEGLDTRVGKQGMRLSGGEQQRLCVARALIEHPNYPKHLLLVDEATSSLDSDTEVSVQKGIDITLDRGMSAVVIAHRFSTLRNCNHFVFLKKLAECNKTESQVAYECGSLEELYECSPEFRAQADLQGFSI
jgi:ATP-binding cassette subfamily B protein